MSSKSIDASTAHRWRRGLLLLRESISGQQHDYTQGSIGRAVVRLLAITAWVLLGFLIDQALGARLPRPLSGLPVFEILVPLLGLWPALARGDRAALHDLIAGTRVVRARASGRRGFATI